MLSDGTFETASEDFIHKLLELLYKTSAKEEPLLTPTLVASRDQKKPKNYKMDLKVHVYI